MATVLTAIVCVFIVCHTPKAALNLYEVGTVGCNFKKRKICLDLVIASPIYCFKSFPSLNLPFLGDYPLTRIGLTMLCPPLIVWLFFATFFCQSCRLIFLIFFTNTFLANQADLFFCQFLNLFFANFVKLYFGKNILSSLQVYQIEIAIT